MTGWRRHLPLRGKPDLTFVRQRVVIFEMDVSGKQSAMKSAHFFKQSILTEGTSGDRPLGSMPFYDYDGEPIYVGKTTDQLRN